MRSVRLPQTLTDFLAYATDNYPADRTAVILWDHGGGSVNGVCADELYEFDALELPELYTAFRDVWQPDESDPALELIGFDACLMATVDVADTFREFAHYMVAPEGSYIGLKGHLETREEFGVLVYLEFEEIFPMKVKS